MYINISFGSTPQAIPVPQYLKRIVYQDRKNKTANRANHLSWAGTIASRSLDPAKGAGSDLVRARKKGQEHIFLREELLFTW